MAKELLKFTCQNAICEKRDNFVELPESEAKRTKWLLYCGNCGHVVETKKEVKKGDDGKKWLPCIDYTGPMSQQTRGPVPDPKGGYVWGAPASNESISEKKFIENFHVNPRIEWCRRSDKNKSHPVCKFVGDREEIKPVEYSVPDPIIGRHTHTPEIPPH